MVDVLDRVFLSSVIVSETVAANVSMLPAIWCTAVGLWYDSQGMLLKQMIAVLNVRSTINNAI